MAPAPAAFAAALFAVVLLAGCSGKAPPADPALGPDGTPTTAGLLALPTWALGDWWSYGIEVGPGEESATTYVITEDKGADWWMDTDSPERAFQDARSDISRLGAQRKNDLAGSQGSDRVEFFQWPLTANDTWTTRWDGNDATIRVASVDASGATLTARNATHLMYTYRYDADAGWFKQLDRHAPDGSVAFTLLLLDHGSLWAGTAVRWELTTLVHASGSAQPMLTMVEPDLAVPEGTTDLWLHYDLVCQGGGSGGYTIAVRPQPPALGGYDMNGQCVDPISYTGVVAEDPVAGPWSLSLVLGGGPVAPTYVVEFLARKLVDVPVGA